MVNQGVKHRKSAPDVLGQLPCSRLMGELPDRHTSDPDDSAAGMRQRAGDQASLGAPRIYKANEFCRRGYNTKRERCGQDF